MTLPIEISAASFKKALRGEIKKNMGKYMKNGELIGRKGKELVSIPMPYIELPKFRHWRNSSGGGMGISGADIGTPLGPGKGNQQGSGAGDSPAGHIREVEISLKELAEIMG